MSYLDDSTTSCEETQDKFSGLSSISNADGAEDTSSSCINAAPALDETCTDDSLAKVGDTTEEVENEEEDDRSSNASTASRPKSATVISVCSSAVSERTKRDELKVVELDGEIEIKRLKLEAGARKLKALEEKEAISAAQDQLAIDLKRKNIESEKIVNLIESRSVSSKSACSRDSRKAENAKNKK